MVCPKNRAEPNATASQIELLGYRGQYRNAVASGRCAMTRALRFGKATRRYRVTVLTRFVGISGFLLLILSRYEIKADCYQAGQGSHAC